MPCKLFNLFAYLFSLFISCTDEDPVLVETYTLIMKYIY